MSLITYDFDLQVTPGAMPPIVHVSEYDVGRTYTVTINGENGSVFNIPTGTTATVEGTLNGVIGFTTDATISGSTVSFALTESMTAKSGKAWCKIKLSLNDEPIQTCAFILDIDRAGVEADTVIGADGFEQQIVNAVNAWLDEHPPASGGMTEAFKQALLDCFENVAWINDQGQTYYDALYAALYPPVDVLSISAVFTQGSAVIYDTDDLETLRQYLTVTATYDDSSTGVVTDYTLSGLLEAPSSTVTVLYDGVSTTFTAAVTARPVLSSITAVYSQSGTVYDTDTLDSLKADLVVTALYSDGTTQTVAAEDYTLSGALTAGTSTITVEYGGKTTTFNVTVTGILPAEYQRVEYIANPSDAYIATTIPVALGNTVHVQSLLSSKPSATMNVCGGTAINQNRAYVSYSTSNNYVGAWVGYVNCFPLVSDLYASVLDSITTVSSGSVYFKGKNASTENEKTETGTTTALTALELFRAGSAGGAFTGRVYFLEVLNGETATARLYPCYRKSDNKVGMYDTVNSKFYTSANSTAFTKGANV